MSRKIKIIGIGGGSSSGKTYLCNELVNIFGNDKILAIQIDAYYKDLKHLKMEDREKIAFEAPFPKEDVYPVMIYPPSVVCCTE